MFYTMPNLPPELHREIIEGLEGDRESLINVSLTSRSLRQEGQRVLFRNIVIISDSDAFTALDTLQLFSETIRYSDRLALLVKTYSQCLNPLVFRPRLPPRLIDALHQSTFSILPRLVNLLELEFYLTTGDSEGVAKSLLDCAPTFQLTRFSWVTEDFRLADAKEGRYMEQFLRGQPKVTDLAVDLGEWKFLESVPDLQSLSASSSVIQALLPTRPIRTLFFTMCSPATNWSTLSSQLQNITAFSYEPNIYFTFPEALISCMPRLAVLEIRNASCKVSFQVKFAFYC